MKLDWLLFELHRPSASPLRTIYTEGRVSTKERQRSRSWRMTSHTGSLSTAGCGKGREQEDKRLVQPSPPQATERIRRMKYKNRKIDSEQIQCIIPRIEAKSRVNVKSDET
jgi:hypothetical protein